VVVDYFSAGVGRPVAVIQATTGSADVASGENRADVSCGRREDVFGCRFLREDIVYVALVVRLRLLREKP
jgi:hypothetical protein